MSSTNGFSRKTTVVPLRWILTFVVVLGLAAAGVWSYVIVTRPAAIQQPTVTPVLLVVTPERTSTTTIIDMPITEAVSRILFDGAELFRLRQ